MLEKRIEGKIKKTRNDVLIAPIFSSGFRQELHISCPSLCVASRSEPNERRQLADVGIITTRNSVLTWWQT
jgi:hypothetical protein